MVTTGCWYQEAPSTLFNRFSHPTPFLPFSYLAQLKSLSLGQKVLDSQMLGHMSEQPLFSNNLNLGGCEGSDEHRSQLSGSTGCLAKNLADTMTSRTL